MLGSQYFISDSLFLQLIVFLFRMLVLEVRSC